MPAGGGPAAPTVTIIDHCGVCMCISVREGDKNAHAELAAPKTNVPRLHVCPANEVSEHLDPGRYSLKFPFSVI